MRSFFLLIAAMIATLFAVYFAVSVYFCSGPLDGDFGGCAAMSGSDIIRSATAQLAALCCLVSVAIAAMRRRR